MGKPKDGNIGMRIKLTDSEERAKAAALKLSPDIKKLSKPFITDNGRTQIFFKPGVDPQQAGEHFVKLLAERSITA